ncbi:MAG: M12 family metallopeptidase, partial [Myxococcota bacterium]|nr:M12 family metallopeptidase [Myxococcota bacterium]
GILDPGEGCDDGNTDNGDGCASNCVSEAVVGDAEPCDTTEVDLFGLPTAELDTFCDDPDNRDTYWPGDTIRVRIMIHVTRSDDGSLAIDEPTLEAVVEDARSYLDKANIDLDWGGFDAIDLIDGESFYNLEQDRLTTLFETNNAPNAVDVYVVNSFWKKLCGRASGIGSSGGTTDGVILKAGCSGNTLAHELGHLFGLWHTHRKYEDDPDGESCDVLGDLCCDTPPDPGPKNDKDDEEDTAFCHQVLEQDCDKALDCGDTGASPDPYNTMSYYSACKRLAGTFTPQQHGRLRCYLARNDHYALGSWSTANCEPDCQGKSCGDDDGCDGQCTDCSSMGPNYECMTAQPGTPASCECVPDCDGAACGGDGCDGSCGDCPNGGDCTESGACACTPGCAGEWTLEDDCSLGVNCATLTATCVIDPTTQLPECQAPCSPDCSGKSCGGDGCGGACGLCPSGESCNTDGQCEVGCVPDCAGKACGEDGCGGFCGDCDGDETCNAGAC